MNRFRIVIRLLVIGLLFVFVAPILAKVAVDVPGTMVKRGDASSKKESSVTVMSSSIGHETDQLDACRQVVGNPQMDVKKTGPGVGTVDPWFYLKQEIYYFEEGDGSGLAYDGFSLLLPDGDDGDPSPNSDILAQIVTFDADLDSVFIAYQRLMLDSNPIDEVFGELWLLTKDGGIDLTDPDQYRVFRWQISESEDEWSLESKQVDKDSLARLEGQEIALLLRTETDGGGATEADMEWVLFDDVTMTACPIDKNSYVYLPVVFGK